MSKIALIVTITVLFFSCINRNVEREKQNYIKKITPNDDIYLKNKECIELFKGYFKRLDIEISNYYELIDLSVFNKSDTIAIISPKILTPTASSYRDENVKLINTRLLIINKQNKVKVYEDIISNNIGNGNSGCESIEITKEGFSLIKSEGQAVKLDYVIDIKFEENIPYITKIILVYSSGKKLIKKTFNYDNFLLKDYKSNETINELLKSLC